MNKEYVPKVFTKNSDGTLTVKNFEVPDYPSQPEDFAIDNLIKAGVKISEDVVPNQPISPEDAMSSALEFENYVESSKKVD